jgi:hypothetical protein
MKQEIYEKTRTVYEALAIKTGIPEERPLNVKEVIFHNDNMDCLWTFAL